MAKDGGRESHEIWIRKIDEEAAGKFREAMIQISKKNQHVPIVVHIDSYGGFIDSMSVMIATMEEVPNPIVTVCMGKAMSAGAILLSHGDMRFCNEHASVMVHELSGGQEGDVHDNHNAAKEGIRLNEHFMGLLAKNCKIKGGYRALRQTIKDNDGRNKYMTAQEAKDFGIVDFVGEPMILATTMYEVHPAPTKEQVQQMAEEANEPKKKKVAKRKTAKKKVIRKKKGR